MLLLFNSQTSVTFSPWYQISGHDSRISQSHKPANRINKMKLSLEIFYNMCMSQCIALTLPDCADNNSTEVDETSNTSSVTCSGINMTATVVWNLNNIFTENVVNIGECYLNGSCSLENNAYVISRPNASVSYLTFLKPGRFLQNRTIVCSSRETTTLSIISCRLDVIYPANVSKCTLSIARDPWKITGSCEISKVFSSIGNYMCDLYMYTTQSFHHETKVNTTAYEPITHSDWNYTKGYCNFSSELPYNEGQYLYKAVVRPGNKEYIFESINIVKPSMPRITICTPNKWVPKNSEMSCSCSANSLGQPQGRLLWLHNHTRLQVGEYGGLSLDFKTTFNGGNSEEEFECAVEWIKNSSAAKHTALVPHAVTNIRFMANYVLMNLTINEHESLTFTCVANGRPKPKVDIFGESFTEPIFRSTETSGTPLNENTLLNASIDSASCSHSLLYMCITSNGFGEPLNETIQLYVNCKPRRSTFESLRMEFSGHPINLTFTLLAYPKPVVLAVYFIGHSLNGSDTSKITRYSNLLDISCWTAAVYKTVCSIRVKNMSKETAGYYRITFMNAFGQENVTFQVILMEKRQGIQMHYLLTGVAVLFITAIVLSGFIIIIRKKRKADEKMNSTTQSENLHRSNNAINGLYGERNSVQVCGGASSRNRDVCAVVKKCKIVHSYINVFRPEDRKSACDTNAIQLQPFQIQNTDEMNNIHQQSSNILSKEEIQDTNETEKLYYELSGSPPNEIFEDNAYHSRAEKNDLDDDSVEGELFYASVQIWE